MVPRYPGALGQVGERDAAFHLVAVPEPPDHDRVDGARVVG